MHELSLCQNIIDQLHDLAGRHNAGSVRRLVVQVGALSGVEPQLLEQAFGFAQIGTLAEHASLVTEFVAPRVACLVCGEESGASANDLRCAACKSTETRLVSGGELILAKVELVPAEAGTKTGTGN